MLAVDILSCGESWVLEVCKQGETANTFIITEMFSSCAQRFTPDVPGTWVADAGVICPEIETALGSIIRLPMCTKHSPYSLYHYLSFIH